MGRAFQSAATIAGTFTCAFPQAQPGGVADSQAHDALTSSETCCSMVLSSRPGPCQSMAVGGDRWGSVVGNRWPTLERYRLLLAKLVTCKDLWLGAARLAEQDGRVGIVLLHGGVAALEEVPRYPNISLLALPIPNLRLVSRWRIAVFRAGVCGGGRTVSQRCARWSGRTGTSAP